MTKVSEEVTHLVSRKKELQLVKRNNAIVATVMAASGVVLANSNIEYSKFDGVHIPSVVRTLNCLPFPTVIECIRSTPCRMRKIGTEQKKESQILLAGS
jgi:hypothetical protein